MPPQAEQEDIVRRVGDELAPLSNAIDRLNGEIDLLREYRTRLVADVVTGKLDVREAAALLPDEHADEDRMDEGRRRIEADDLAAEDLDALTEEAQE